MTRRRKSIECACRSCNTTENYHAFVRVFVMSVVVILSVVRIIQRYG